MSNKKLDPKVRFQQPRFKSRLQEARAYKRSSHNGQGKSAYLETIRPKTWVQKTAFFVGALLIFYVLYIPNILYVKKISVQKTGVESSNLEPEVKNYFSSRKFFAQQNIVMLSSKNLAEYLRSQNPDFASVNVQKKFPNELLITITPRHDEYLLHSPNGYYAITADGSARGLPGPASSSPLTKIEVADPADISGGKVLFSSREMAFFSETRKLAAEILNTQVESFALGQIKGQSAVVLTRQGYKLFLDSSLPPAESLQKASLILQQLTEKQKASLVYLDVRLENKGFACLEGTACAKNTEAVSTSTPTSTPSLMLKQ